jgi:hypothetical protein
MSMGTAPVQEKTNVAAAAARMMTTAEATVETLLRHGIPTVYELPGAHNDDLFAFPGHLIAYGRAGHVNKTIYLDKTYAVLDFSTISML